MTNEYDDLLASDGAKDEARTNLRASALAALPVNPDQAAEARRLSKSTGVPAPVVERNLDKVKQQATLNEYDRLLESAPVTASKMQDRQFAKVSHDERDQLAEIEAFVKNSPGQQDTSAGAALNRGVAQLGVLGEAAGYGLDRLLTAIGRRFLPEPRIPGGEIDATGSQAKTSLVEVANLYSNLPRDKRVEFAGELVNRAAAEGQTLRGVGDAVGYLARNPGAAVNYLLEMTPSAAAGGGIGGLAAKPVAARAAAGIVARSTAAGVVTPGAAAASQMVARGVTAAGVTAAGTTVNAFPSELAGQIQQGAEVDDAIAYAGKKATVEGAANAPFAFVGGMIPLGSTLLGRTGNILGQAGLQGTGGAVGATAAAASVGEQITPGEQFLEAFFEFASAPSDIAIAAATDVAERRNATKVQADQATAAADYLNKIMAAAAASKTRTRDPETFAQLVQDAAEASGTAPTEVFIDAQPLVETLQKAGMTEAQIREALPSVFEQLGTEAATGGTVAIPIGEAVTAFSGTGVEAELVRHVRTSPDGFSVADSEQALAQLEAMDADAQRIIAEQQDADAWEMSAKAVEDTLFTQFEGAGRWSSDVNRVLATVARNFFVTQADTVGVTPEELYRQFPLTVSGVAPTGQVLSQPGGVFDWSNPGGKGAGGFHSRDTKIGDTTISYGVGADGTAEIISVRTPQAKRGKGSARQALAKFLEEADARGLTVKLQASPLDKKTNLGKLVEFYKSLGFEPTGKTINPAGDPEMVRRPPTTFDQEANGTTPYTADTIEVDGKTRPVMNNKGQRIAQTEEGLRNFWRWFGDSDVREAATSSKQRPESLPPIVVYHSTNKDFEVFEAGRETVNSTTFGDVTTSRQGIFLAEDPGFAEGYGKGEGQRVMPVYLSIQNPLYLDEGISGEDLTAILNNAEGKITRRDFYDLPADAMWQAFDGDFGKAFVDAAKAAGFDGALMVESDPATGESRNVWVAFTPTQIKSATGNRGTFNPADPNILNQEDGYTDEELDFLVATGSLSPEQAATLKASAKTGAQNADPRTAGAGGRAQQSAGTAGRPADQVAGRTAAGTAPRSGWETATAVRGADGKPRTVYRGGRTGRVTAENFNPESFGKATGYPLAGLGVFFTTWSSDAQKYADEVGGRVGEFQLDIRNPRVLRENELPKPATVEEAVAFREALRAKGYDGIAIDYREVGGPVQLVAFDPEQVIVPEEALYQEANDAWYFSPLQRAVEGIKQETAPASQWLATITKQPGVKPDELEWTGLPEFLKAQQGKVTKAQILEYLAGNGVQVEEVMKGDADVEGERARLQELFAAQGYELEIEYDEVGYLDAEGEPVEYDDLPEDLQQAIDRASIFENEAQATGTKYDKYVLPGGQNYRELLLTLPVMSKVEARYIELQDMTRALTSAEQAEYDRLGAEITSKGASAYQSSHWDEANILAHIRFNERTDADGKRVLFIEEIQSDWGQEGKKKGFATKKYRVVTQFGGNVLKLGGGGHGIYDTRAEAEERIANGNSSWRVEEVMVGVPAAPFVGKTDAWVALAIKRMIRYAAENGFDRVAFVNGEQSAERYDLSKQVDAVAVEPAGDGTYDIRVELLDGGTRNLNGKTAQEVEDAIGKELAAKAIAAADQWRDANRKYREALKRDDVPESDLDTLRAERDAIETEFTGLDLKVGGEGMKAFYDKIVPKVAKDVLKKLGGGGLTTARIDIASNKNGHGAGFRPEEMQGRPVEVTFKEMSGDYSLVMEGTNITWGAYPSEAAASAALEKLQKAWDGQQGSPQLAFDITPEMREQALAGMALFQSVYHGSPYRFSKFSLEHMGKGEGAQAYGWGLYFAGKRDIAEHYRQVLSDVTVDPVDLKPARKGSTADKLIRMFGAMNFLSETDLRKAGVDPDNIALDSAGEISVKRFIKEGFGAADSKALDDGSYLFAFDDGSAFIDKDGELKAVQGVKGQLYEVNIPDEGYLLWDKPLSEQPEAVRQALEKAGVVDIVNGKLGEGLGAVPMFSNIETWLTGEKLYRRLVDREFERQGDVTSAARKRGEEAASRFLNSIGIAGIQYLDGTSRADGDGSYNYVIFDDAAIEILQTFYQQEGVKAQPEKQGSFNPATLNIALLEKADLSTALHELGHFFFEMQATIAARPDAPARIAEDVATLLKAVGFEGTAAEWLAQPLNDRREGHEQVAETFEQYLLTGKAPSLELQGLFNRMRAWMLSVYKTLKRFFAIRNRAGLSPEVSAVFDRMLATDAAIAEAKRTRAMTPLFKSAEEAGMDPEAWAAYQQAAGQVDEDAIRDLDARQVRDMKWLRSARSKMLKELQKDASAKRREARIEARRRLLQEPVYRAMQFLRGKVEKAPVEKKSKGLDTRRDDLLTAIAKLGGINKEAAVAEWGIDPKDFANSPVVGKPILRAGKAGLSPDGMAEALAEVGYLMPKDGAPFVLTDLEDMLADAARGIAHYSVDADYDLIHGYKTLPAPDDLGEQPFAAGRLSRPDLEARFAGTDVEWQKLGIGRRGMVAEVGMGADAVANIVGFNTGEEMVKALLAAEPLQEATEALTDQIMLERHGDITSPEGLQRAADEALANDAHAKMLATEYARLNKAVGSPRAVERAAREAAQQTVDRQAVRLARPEKATAAAARAGRAAEKAHAAGNLDEAAAFKRNQILNTAIARAQRELRTFVDKAQGDFAKMFGKDAQLAKTRDMNLVNLARAAMAQYGLAPEVGGMKALQYLDLVADYDPPLAANLKSMLNAMPEGKDYRDLTGGEFRTVADLVRGMWEMSRGVKQITIDGKKVELDAVADELVEAVLANNGGETGTLPGRSGTTTMADDLRVGALGIKSMLTRVEQWADFMGPAFKRYVWQPVSEAVTRYRARRTEMVKQYRDLLKTIEPGLTFHKIHAPELGLGGFTFNGGKSEVLHAILHSGNESNLRKLLLGRGWAALDEEGNVDTSKWQEFVQRMVDEGVLTREDFDFVQGVWDLLETVKGDAQRAHRELYGYYFNEVTASPFVDPFGVERAGGYVPAIADGLSSPDAMQKREQEELLHAGNSFMFPSTGKGFTQARVEYNRPLELDLRTIVSHLDKVTRFAYIEPAVRDVGKILLNSRVKRALNGYDQTIISQMLNPWLQRAARQTVSTPGKNRWADKFFNALRTRSGVVIMFANVVNTLQQLTGFSVAAVKVPAPKLLRAAYRMTRNPKQMADEAATLSPWLANRMAGQSFEMQQQIENILLNPNPVARGNEFLKRNAYFMQQAMQNVMDPVIWWGAYDHAIEQGLTQQDAVRAADSAVRTTQGTFAPEDVAAFESNTAFVRLFTQFYGYFNMLGNTLGAEAKKAIRDMGYGAATPRLLFIWFAGLALPAVVAEVIARGLPDDEDDEDGDGTLDEWLALFFGSQFRTLAAMVPGAGQGVSLAVNLTDDKVYNDRLSLSPGMSMAETTIRGGVNLLQGEVFDERLTKSEVRDTLTMIGMAVGAPTGPLARAGGYLADVENGRADPESAPELVKGLVVGR